MKIGGQPRDDDEAQAIHDAIMVTAVRVRFQRAMDANGK